MVKEANNKTLVSAKVAKAKESLLLATGHLDIDRVKILLEVYEQNKEQPAVIKRAKIFERLCSEKPIFIDDNPIVGTLTKFKYGGYPMPEIGCRWMRKAKKFGLSRGLAPVTAEDREWIDQVVDYWEDNSVFERTRQIFLQTHNVDIGILQKCGLGTILTASRPLYTIPDYEKVLTKGLGGILDEIESAKAKLDPGTIEDLNKFYFYEGTSLCLSGLIRLANRYAALANEMAKKETDAERKQDLELIASICDRVPANPARNFHEALQTVWFIVLGVWLETQGALSSPLAKFTQYMYPFFEKDKRDGKLTDEAAIELLQLFYIKVNGLANAQSPHAVAYNQSRLSVYLTLGGMTPDGADATNELDFIVLEAQKRIKLPEPLIALIYHNKLSDSFLLKCVDLIKTGIGMPSFHDAEKAIARHLYHDKMSIEEARNLAIMGCVQSVIPGYSAMPWESFFNSAKIIELVLNNGKEPRTGIQLGPETGDLESFNSYDDLYQAVVRQMEYFIPLVRQVARTSWNIARDLPIPFQSALTNDCIEVGLDATNGGARYHVGNGTALVGTIDCANSLAAIKKLVFEEKRISLAHMREALVANFEGYEDIQRMCFDAPKYGNDDKYVDQIAKDLYEICYTQHQRFPVFFWALDSS